METDKIFVVRKQIEPVAIFLLTGIIIGCIFFIYYGWYDTIEEFVFTLCLGIIFAPASINALCWQLFGKETFIFKSDCLEITKGYWFLKNKQTVGYHDIKSVNLSREEHIRFDSIYSIKVILRSFFLAGGIVEISRKDGSMTTCYQGNRKKVMLVVNELRHYCSINNSKESTQAENRYSSYRKGFIASIYKQTTPNNSKEE